MLGTFFLVRKPIPTWFYPSKAMQKKERQPKISLTLFSFRFFFTFIFFFFPSIFCTRMYGMREHCRVCVLVFHTNSPFYCILHSPYPRYSLFALCTPFWFRAVLCWNTTKTLYTECDTLYEYLTNSTDVDCRECSFHFSSGWPCHFGYNMNIDIFFGWGNVSSYGGRCNNNIRKQK